METHYGLSLVSGLLNVHTRREILYFLQTLFFFCTEDAEIYKKKDRTHQTKKTLLLFYLCSEAIERKQT